ncbi:efflux RND transporter periplasmic adaptor subunit [Candidatus Poribacteria bacterium]|nr:efflux RND transporter periplasmic adaptor subunit [Candidatus Poribacteria bacterium]
MKNTLSARTIILAFFILLVIGMCKSNVYYKLAWGQDKNDKSHVDEENIHIADKHTVTLTDKAKANIGLKIAEADIRTIEKVLQITGNIIPHPAQQANVTPRIGGIVKKVNFNLGDSVNKGDVLIELDSVDLKLAGIDLVEAVNQQKSLKSQLGHLKEVLAKQIKMELQTRQIDYFESFAEQNELMNTFERQKTITVAKTMSALEQLRIDYVQADIEMNLLGNSLERIISLAEKRISAHKELIAKKAEFSKAKKVVSGIKRQFQLLGVSNQTLIKILQDDGSTPILTLLQSDKISKNIKASPDQIDPLEHVLQYITLTEEVSDFVQAESAYKLASIKAEANKLRAITTGLTIDQLDSVIRTGSTILFTDLTNDELINLYEPYLKSSETLEALHTTEESYRNSEIILTKVRQQLRAFGLSETEIDQITKSGQTIELFSVTAPMSGKIIQQGVSIGETVEKNDSLFSILNTSTVLVEGEAYETSLTLLNEKWQTGSNVRIRVPAYPEKVFTGKISQISSVVDPQKRTVHFWTEVVNPEQLLKPGMFADKSLVINEIDDVLSVPLAAILTEGTTSFVFVQSGDSYVKQEVETGIRDDRFVEIKDGLYAGELVVIQGTHQLQRATTGTSEVVDPHAGHSH